MSTLAQELSLKERVEEQGLSPKEQAEEQEHQPLVLFSTIPTGRPRRYVRRSDSPDPERKERKERKEREDIIEGEKLAHCTYEKTPDGVHVTVDFGNRLDTDSIFSKLLQNPAITSIRIQTSLLSSAHCLEIAESLQSNTTLKTLEIDSSIWGGVTDKGVIPLAEALTPSSSSPYNSTLTTLKLWGNSHYHMTEKGAESLADMLETNSTLKHLFLHNNYINDKGACAMASMLKKNKSLQDLSLGFNCISSTGFIEIAKALATENTTLLNLDLNKNIIFSGDVDALRKIFWMSNSYNGSEDACVALVEMLRKNRTLQFLDLDMTGFCEREAKILSEVISEGCSLDILRLYQPNGDINTLSILYDAVSRNKTKVPSIYFASYFPSSLYAEDDPRYENDFNKLLIKFISHMQERTPARKCLSLSSSPAFDKTLVQQAIPDSADGSTSLAKEQPKRR